MLTTVGPLFGLMAAGFLARRLGVLGAGAGDALNRFTVYLALPALLFLSTAETPARAFGGGAFAATITVSLFGTFVVALLLAPRARPPADRVLEALASAYPNTGFMGIPLVSGLLGRDVLPLAIVAALLTVSALFAVALGLVELALASRDGRGGGIGGASLRALAALERNPIVVAPILGAVWNAAGIAVPPPLRAFATLLGGASTPVALVTIGVVLAATGGGGMRASAMLTIGRVVGLKLLVQPLLCLVLAVGVFHLGRRDVAAAVLLMALPIGTGPFMLAKLYDREEGETGGAVLLSTVLSLATIPAAVALLGV